MRLALSSLALLFWIAMLHHHGSVETIDKTSVLGLPQRQQPTNNRHQTRRNKATLERVHNITKTVSPSFAKGGGLIFFLHIPKTGGTTIRRSFRKMKGVDYFFARHKTDYNNKALPAIRNVLENKNENNTVFVEVHANSCPHLLELRQALTSWRETARKNGVPIFFFTMLRDPVDFAISYFNFFHVQQILGVGAHSERCAPTLENFLRLTRSNPQCEFLSRGGTSLIGAQSPANPLTERDCRVVYDAIRETMDWVGTTEKMTDDTLLVLSNLTSSKRSSFKTYNGATHVREELGMKDIGESGLKIVLARSSFDTTLYEQLQIDYA